MRADIQCLLTVTADELSLKNRKSQVVCVLFKTQLSLYRKGASNPDYREKNHYLSPRTRFLPSRTRFFKHIFLNNSFADRDQKMTASTKTKTQEVEMSARRSDEGCPHLNCR